MFVGRERELSKLNELYEGGAFECVVVYGRRRVGKTRLITEFIKDKEAIYFSGIESNEQENLENFSGSIFAFSSQIHNAGAFFPSFQKAWEAVFSLAKERRVVLAFDEYPYAAAAYPGLSSLLKEFIDRNQEESKLFLILCGSSLSFMENQVLGYQSPLFGRRTAQLKIEPLTFYEMRGYYKNLKIREAALVYGLTGGVPQYMGKIYDKFSLAQNIRDNFFDPSSYLFEEPLNLVKQECREPALYNAIIKAIASGASKLSEIASRTGLTTAVCSNYLSTLASLGIIRKEFPFNEKKAKKTFYSVADSMFRFWYRFIPSNMALIQNGQKELVYKRVLPELPAFMGSVFEEICKQWLWRENSAGRLPFVFTQLGRWWGNDPIRKQEAEIDIIGAADVEAIFCECKWTNEKTGQAVLQSLIDRSGLFSYRRKFLYVFSKSGFTEGCVKAAKESGARLVCFDDMK
jgi:AAA+ ATPase superfamily predicted ATPase